MILKVSVPNVEIQYHKPVKFVVYVNIVTIKWQKGNIKVILYLIEDNVSLNQYYTLRLNLSFKLMININQDNKRFENREAAAVLLVNELKKIIDKKDYPITVLAIPRGDIVLGDIIASSLNVKLDIIISKKIGSPDNTELAIGAVTHDGSFFPNEEIIEKLGISQEYIKKQISIKVKEIEIRLNKLHVDYSYYLKNNTIILVDDGIATGATTFAAIKWLRNQNPKKIILAGPVEPRYTANLIYKIVDKSIILSTPLIFFAVGEFYDNFSEVTDNQVLDIMSKYR